MVKDELLKRMRSFENDYKPCSWMAVRMQDISALCDIIENAIPSIDLLQTRLEQGNCLKKQDGKWWLFDTDGEGITSGYTLRDILVNLIFLDC